MGKKLDALLGRKFKTSKFKATVNLAISRLSVLKNQRQARLAVARSDVTQLLNLNHHEHALLRVDQVIKEQNMLDVFAMIDGYCHLLLQRVNLIEEEKDCPDELKEAASSLLYAAPRCGEFPELKEIRAILTSRFGKEFAYGAIELRGNCGVSPKMIQKLSPRQSSLESRMKILREMAAEHDIILQLEDASPVIKEGGLVVEQNQNQTMAEAEVEAVSVSTKLENHSTILPEEVVEVLSLPESMKGRKKYRDVADAAQAAFESAAYAASAARAAVELSRSGSFGSDNPGSPNTRPRKVLDSKPTKSNLQTGYKKSHESESKSEHEHEASNVDNEGERPKTRSNTNSADSDGSASDRYKQLEKVIAFDESDKEIDNEDAGFPSSRNHGEESHAKQGTYPNEIFDSSKDYYTSVLHNMHPYETSPKRIPFRHQASLKTELDTERSESLFGEGLKMQQEVQPLDVIKKRPISVRTRRVHGR